MSVSRTAMVISSPSLRVEISSTNVSYSFAMPYSSLQSLSFVYIKIHIFSNWRSLFLESLSGKYSRKRPWEESRYFDPSPQARDNPAADRSEERRVGKECRS